jgi:uncharacterized protein DUF4386
MIERIAEASPRSRARITGVVYLLFFVTAFLGAYLTSNLNVSGDAAATASQILAHESLLRFGVITSLFSTACYVALAALFYGLFKPVNRSLSLVAAFLSLAGCGILIVGSFFQLVPLVLLGGSKYLSVFNAQQLQALAYLFLQLNGDASNLSLVFFALYDFLIGYLIFRSTFLPRILGVLMMLAGSGWMAFLAPPVADHLSLYLEGLGILAEALLMLWLVVRGINTERWKEQRDAAVLA